MNLFENFKKLPPSLEANEGKYIVENILENKNHKIARSISNRPIILFKVSDDDPISSNLNLQEYWRILRTRSYETVTIMNEETQDMYTIIDYLDNEESLQKIFLDVISLIVNDLEITTSNSAISNYISSLKKLLVSKKNKKNNDIQGLWAELFIIYSLENKEKALTAYQSENLRDLWDFYNLGRAIEIKSTNKNQRIHKFKYEQLESKSDEIYIISVITKKSENGKSIENIITNIEDSITNKYLKFKISCIKKSINSANEYSSIKFDEEQALKSLRVYFYKDIPRIKKIESGISDLTYKVDLSFAKQSSLQLSDLFED